MLEPQGGRDGHLDNPSFGRMDGRKFSCASYSTSSPADKKELPLPTGHHYQLDATGDFEKCKEDGEDVDVEEEEEEVEEEEEGVEEEGVEE